MIQITTNNEIRIGLHEPEFGPLLSHLCLGSISIPTTIRLDYLDGKYKKGGKVIKKMYINDGAPHVRL